MEMEFLLALARRKALALSMAALLAVQSEGNALA
jgi:hypothetical protein